jgi:hypothetical protein
MNHGYVCKLLHNVLYRFTVSAVFYGLAFNISFLFGDKYVNFGISEAVDMCAVVLAFWAVPRYMLMSYITHFVLSFQNHPQRHEKLVRENENLNVFVLSKFSF